MDKININFSLSNDWFLNRDALVFGVFEGDSGPCGINFKKETIEDNFHKIDPIFKNIKSHLEQGDFKAKFGEIFLTYLFDGSPVKRVIVIGLGKKLEFNNEKLRQAGAKVAQYARDLGVKNLTTTIFGSPEMDAKSRFRNLMEGISLSLYRFDKFKSRNEGDEKKVVEVEFLFPENVEINSEEWEDELKRSQHIISAVYLARNLANNPASVVTPEFLAKVAREIAKSSTAFTCDVFKREELEKMGMNAVLDVGKGSDSEPHFIVLNYKPANAERLVLNVAQYEVATIKISQTHLRAIVGEITFDSLNSEREYINKRLSEGLARLTESWGMNIISAEPNLKILKILILVA